MDIDKDLKNALNGASQFNGLTPMLFSPQEGLKRETNHGKSVGTYTTIPFMVNLSARMICLSTSRLTEFFIKGDVDNFYWLGFSNYVVHPKNNMILNVRTGRPVTVNDGKVQLTGDGGKRNCYTIEYIYEALRDYLKE